MGSHDLLFKAVFSEPANAVAHFGSFLPAEITATLDMGRAQHVPGSFVDEALSEHHTDLLYRIPLRQKSAKPERELLLYLVFDCEGSHHARVPYRVICYSMKVWEHWLQEHTELGFIPPIIPLVIHHSPPGLRTSLEQREQWSLASTDQTTVAALSAFLSNLRVLLDRAGKPAGDAAPVRIDFPVEILYSAQDSGPDFFGLMPVRKGKMHAPEGLRFVALMVEYLLTVNDAVTLESLAGVLAPTSDEAKEITMTVGELLKEQGRREGEQKGLQIGREEGRHAARLDVARKALAKGMSSAEVAALTDLSQEEVQKLTH